MLFLVAFLLALATTDAFLGIRARPIVVRLNAELDTGDFNCEFTRVAPTVLQNIASFKLAATIKSKDLNIYLNEYKDEMKRRKVVFPGFRAGKLPPYVMPDVRKYLVSYGLETILGQLANLNGLELCSEGGEPIPFGEDAYYAEIIKADFRGYDFEKQRDAWREGTDFSFVAEFYAKEEGAAEETSPSNVIDAEVIENA